MLDKIRGLMKTSESIDDIRSDQKKAHKELKELQDEIKNVKKELIEMQKANNDFKKSLENSSKSFGDTAQSLNNLKTEFERSLDRINLLNMDLQKKMQKELEEKVGVVVKEFKDKVSPYKDIEKLSEEVSSQLKTVVAELQKFQAISKTINEKDFELVKFGRMLEQNDREKLDMIKKIESLEKIMAAMKRNRQ